MRARNDFTSGLKIRHLILFVLCVMYFIAYIDRVNISVAGPIMRKELGLTPTELGLIFSAFAYPYAAMQIAGAAALRARRARSLSAGREGTTCRCATRPRPTRGCRSASRPARQHRWRVGDLVLWDNRCTMHRRDAFDPAARRVMHRTQIKSDRRAAAATTPVKESRSCRPSECVNKSR